MGCGGSKAVHPTSEVEEPIPSIDEFVTPDNKAPSGISANMVCNPQTMLIRDGTDPVQKTGFGFIDAVFMEMSGAFSNASAGVNKVSVIRERITAVGAAVAGAPLLEVEVVGSTPVVSIMSLAGETKRVLTVIDVEGVKGLDELSRESPGARGYARHTAAALQAAVALAAKSGPALTFKATAGSSLSMSGYDGKLEAPPVSVMESKDGIELGLISVAELRERRRKRHVAKGLLKEGEELGDDDDDDEEELDEAEIGEAEKVAAETEGGEEDTETGAGEEAPGKTTMRERVAAKAAAAKDAAEKAAVAAKQQASALKQQASGLLEKASKTAAVFADPEERRLFYHEARLRLKLRDAQAKANAEVVEQLRRCAPELYALNTSLVVLAHQLRKPVVGTEYSFDTAAQTLRATIDAEAERQTGGKVVIDRKMELKRLQSGASPLVLTLRGWDGTSQEGKPPVGAAAAAAYELLFGQKGVSQALLPELAMASVLAAAKTAMAFKKLTMLATSCLPGSDLGVGLPTPKIMRLMAQDMVKTGVSGGDLKEQMRRVPATLKTSAKSCVSIAPWLGTTFSATLRAFCVQLRTALRAPGEAPDEGGDDGDDGVAASFESKSGALAKAMEAVPNEIEGIERESK